VDVRLLYPLIPYTHFKTCKEILFCLPKISAEP